MNIHRILSVAIVLFASGESKTVEVKKNLAPGDPIRIGTKYHPKECPRMTKSGDKVSMHYTGTLRTTGEEFDSSVARGTPFDFTLGTGQVIKGWDQGLLGMCIGEKRKLTIPSGLAYGSHGSPPKIPGGATLVFEVELLDIVDEKSEL
uniref:peptidylprolyl isomerase n=1 Tax=Albugo laibachii Nc14 TaxID=890382 RepID=F0W2E8_9STRA|nr:conserved hypothetical protein [Albugo laibachii Nc14]|eukprot:CCA15234.1 conserved hypothetical protein [Albugo laibachii Nc14]